MFYVPYDKTADPWYALGQIAGTALGKAYEARTSREAAKQTEYQKAQELASILSQKNEALQGAYNAYDTAKKKLYEEGQGIAKAYNENPNKDTQAAMEAWIRKVRPGAAMNDNAMTDALNYVYSGQAAPLQGLRQSAMVSAQAINPYVDFTNSNWGTDTYQMGVDRENYISNFENSNKGKTINGKGDKKYNRLPDYLKGGPQIGAPDGPLKSPSELGTANPIQLNLNSQQTPTMQLQNAQPLGGRMFNFGGLEQYVK